MQPRRRSAISRDALYLSPFLLTAILGALVSTGVLIALWLGSAGGPGADANLIVAVGVSSAAWAAVVYAISREKLLRRVEELSDQVARSHADLGDQVARSHADLRQHITAAMAELTDHMNSTAADLAEQAEASGVFRGMDMEAKRHTPERRLRAVPRPTDRVPEARS